MTTLVAGVDEAGRGPVIGPMVISLAIIDKDKESMLRTIGVKDSKLLSPKQREDLLPKLKKMCEFKVSIITAKELNKLMKQRISLNAIEAMKISDLITQVTTARLSKIDKIYIDSPDPTAYKLANRIRGYLPSSVKIAGKLHSTHKADVIYAIAGAASISAKVIRDKEIEKIKKEMKCDFGSGYSHDERTIECLEQNLEHPVLKKYIRTEWATTKNLIQKLSFKTKQVKLDL